MGRTNLSLLKRLGTSRINTHLPAVLAMGVLLTTAFPEDARSGDRSSTLRHNSESRSASTIPVYTFKVINVYPHDRNAFTQGLIFEDGVFIEGTGLYGGSSLRRVSIKTGEILQYRELPLHFFGEGVTIYENRIIQLTWRSHVGFVYDKDSFELLREFNYPTEGWGITCDGRHLIMSDGTANLYFLHPETFAEQNRLAVQDDYGAVDRLNELEFVDGEIYANVFQTDRIARINPKTGRVVGWIDLKGILSRKDLQRPVDVLNGIAYDAEKKRLFVTGKLWPKLFEIELIRLD
ncbi:MAG: glutaminyl-peptide cyclotransferase [Candidatus Poribacteria bacterium]|nr:glutaminyl-peptide cyclotransferase [Candidatus Poribacteria bacterium]MDE0506172.1 glutaminyl-peptide cyclotransferase [Candidatus Poribacteria bacterium]